MRDEGRSKAKREIVRTIKSGEGGSRSESAWERNEAWEQGRKRARKRAR